MLSWSFVWVALLASFAAADERATSYLEGLCNTTSTLQTSGTFGIGTTDATSEAYYKNGENRCWFLETSGAVTLVLTKFHSEFNRDYLRIFDSSDSTFPLLKSISGELVSPYVLRFESTKVMVQFKADDAVHADPVTLQLGFAAEFFDSTSGACANDCFREQGKGTCAQGLCDCADVWGPDGYTDCSVATAVLREDETVDIVDLPIGEWTYFKFELTRRQSFLVELVDVGDVDSDPRVMLAVDTVPTLSHYYFNYNDWFNWYYDNTDIHFLRGDLNPGTYFVGVTNDVFRALEPMNAKLTLRTGNPGSYPCLLDCNGHGTCRTSGNCDCEPGWAGSVVNAPDTCQYPIQPVAFDETYESTVRIGNWDYYELPEITDEDVEFQRSLFVEFASYSPHSYPLVLVRKGAIPRLWEGYLPTYEAFDFDFGDQEGFELVNGQRMNIYVNSTQLTAGSYYVGVYNIWGHNGAGDFNSHDECTYTWSASLYSAGRPCPSTKNGFCDGIPGACDFNVGECSCPEDRLWRDCSFVATELPKDGPLLERTDVAIDDVEYFLVTLSNDDVASKYNLVVTVSLVDPDQGTVPIVLARFGDLPFPNDLSTFDDHDLLSNFYGDATHQILIDAEEIDAKGPGQWYFAVLNPEQSKTTLSYAISARFMEHVPCPSHHENMGGKGVGDECSDAGTCVDTLGRCDCDDGFVLDDCSADGVFELTPGSYFPLDYYALDDPTAPKAKGPPVAPDDWVYFSVVVGCEDRALRVYFTTSNQGSAPFLVLRKGQLPLMVAGTYDYWDYYDGENGREPTQLVYVTACGDDVYGCGTDTCCISPHYPGTTFATGAPEPGVYYIGIYNDRSAAEAIEDYVLRVDVDANFQADDTTEGGCPGVDVPCAPGFLGDKCLDTCPGVAPKDVYSNSPSSASSVCSGTGSCVYAAIQPVGGSGGDDDKVTVCECPEGFIGQSCELACPSAPAPVGERDHEGEEILPCAGRGLCVPTLAAGKTYVATCDCVDGFGGPSCELECDCDHGTCDFSASPPLCGCEAGYVGDACEFECPGLGAKDVCSGNGVCTLVHSYDGAPLRANCECDESFYGDNCDLTCPQGIDATGQPLDCSGRGVCVANADGTRASCECFTDFAGVACERLAAYDNTTDQGGDPTIGASSSSSSSQKSDSGLSEAAAAGLAVVAVALLGLAVGAWFLAERRKKEISRYERLVREVGATSSTVITAAGAARRSDDPEGDHVGSYAAPDDVCRQIGNAPLPDFKQMRDVKDGVSPFHAEKVEL